MNIFAYACAKDQRHSHRNSNDPRETEHLSEGMAEKKAGIYRDCNVVAQERVWKEAVQREANAARQWYELSPRTFALMFISFLNLQGR